MQTKKVYHQVPNLNLIPLEYRRYGVSLGRVLLRLLVILVIIAEVLFVQSLYKTRSVSEAAISSLRQTVVQVEEKVAIGEAIRNEQNAFEATQGELGVEQPDWPEIITAFLEARPHGIALSSVEQVGTQLNAEGSASDYATLLEYRRVLLASAAVSRIVSLQSSKAESAISFSLSARIETRRN